MLEFLNIMVGLPVWFPVLFILLSLIFFSLYVWNMYQTKKWNPENKIFITARKKGNPVLCLFALNGFFKFIIGEKDKKGSPVFKHDALHLEGIRFDPRLQSGAVPKHWTVGGLEMLFGSTSSPFFTSATNVIAMKTVLDHVRKNYPIFNSLSDQTVIEYVGRDRADLPHDCKNLAEVYDLHILPEKEDMEQFAVNYKDALQKSEAGKNMQEDELNANTENALKQHILDFRTGYLAKTIQKIQDETLKMPIQSNRLFSFTELYQNISSAFSSIDIQNFLQLFEMLAKLSDDRNLKWAVTLLIAGGFAVLLVLVGVYVVGLGK